MTFCALNAFKIKNEMRILEMSLESQLELLEGEKDKIRAKIEKRNAKRKIKCASCDESHAICDLTAIQTYHYVEPYSCTGGGYSTLSDMHFICPNKNVRNRLYFNIYKFDIPYEKRDSYHYNPEEQFYRTYRDLFKNIVDDNEEYKQLEWINNEYINNHLEQFGLHVGEDKNGC